MPKIHDISLTLTNDLPVWYEARKAEFKRVRKLEDGDIANVTCMKMSVHAGTHVDAPCHFIKDGDSVENIPLEILIGPAVVIDLPDVKMISAEALEQAKIPENTKRLLIKTKNSQEWGKKPTEFCTKYVAIQADGAQYLVEKGIQLIGVDYLSVAPFEDLVPTHEILLKAGVVIIEALNLSQINSGHYQLYCLPIKIAGADGAPARTILVENP